MRDDADIAPAALGEHAPGRPAELLSVTGVSKAFGDRLAIQDVSFSVARGEIAGQGTKELKLMAFGSWFASHLPVPHDDQRRSWPAYGCSDGCFLAGSTVPFPGSDVDVLAPRSAQAFRSSSA